MSIDGRWAKPTLVGSLVTLRPFNVEDAPAAAEMVAPDGDDLTKTTATFTFEQIQAWCGDRNVQNDRLDLVIVENVTGLFAGEAVLNEYDPALETANFRISLRGPSWFGRGLGSEATRLIVDHGLGAIGLRRITLEVLARNHRARRTYEKVGFRRTGETIDDDGDVWTHMEIVANSRSEPS